MTCGAWSVVGPLHKTPSGLTAGIRLVVKCLGLNWAAWSKREQSTRRRRPVDLTEELPLDDENVLAPEPPSVWRRYRWPIVGAAVVIIAAAIALPLWLTSGSSTPVGLSDHDGDRAGDDRHDPADRDEFGHDRAGQSGQPQLRRLRDRHRGQRQGRPDRHGRPGARHRRHDGAIGAAQRGPGAADVGRRTGSPATRRSSASTSQIDSDQASVTSAESSLSTAQTNLNDASLTSTIAGTVAVGQPDRRTAGDRHRIGTAATRHRLAAANGSTAAAGRRAGSRLGTAVRVELRPDRRDRHRLLHRQHDGRRHPDRPDRRRRPGHITLAAVGRRDARRPGSRIASSSSSDLRHGRLHQPDRQPVLQCHHLPRGDRRDREPLGSLRRRQCRRQHHRQAAQQRDRGPDRRHLVHERRPGHGHRGREREPTSSRT